MRFAGIAIVCVLAAFGAAFLVAHAVIHQAPASAATTHSQATPMPRVKPVGRNHNAELVSQFAPMTAALKHKPKPKPKPKAVHHAAAPASSASSSGSSSQQTYTTPAYTAPAYTPPPATSSPQPTHKRSSGGSGTTTIG